ncbi:MAG: AAA domain-containing protein [Candidatus Gracilibacteria bacterium]|jgi:superfamily I DNA and/or RNA helicase/very-short-patch-repair endonuclease|nr:AAA domain-containing protein [Candidatus Gracilibacteria bacterium]
MSNNIKNPSENLFVKEVGKYFMSFLETDFKKRRIPKRNTIKKTVKDLKVGFDLEKYPKLKKDLVTLFNSGFKKDSITIKKGGYTNNIPDALLKLIKGRVDKIEEESLVKAIKEIQTDLEEKLAIYAKEYDKFLEEAKDDTKQFLGRIFVLPFLDDLDKPLENLDLADENSKFQLEAEIIEALFAVFENQYMEMLQQYFQEKEDFNLEESLKTILTLPTLKKNLVKFFEEISVSDAFYDLYQIYRNNQLIDKTEVYLYFYEIALGKEKFPVFYIPVGIQKEENKFIFNFEKRVYVNTKAIDFVVQEFNQQFGKKDTLAGSFERILYINEENPFLPTLTNIIQKIENFFELNRSIDVQKSDLQKSINLLTYLSNKSYLFLFDRSDEALINDYEEILGNEDLLASFSTLLNGFVEENPRAFMEEVGDEWHNSDIAQKLTVESPIPLNDEQKQVLTALQKENCKFLILEGPPGTGKSHTITAIICKALLEEKSVLVLSDKKEALDVVEDKISETLNKVRHEDGFQNPILRLGKTGNKFYKIVGEQTMNQLKEHYRVYKHKKDQYTGRKVDLIEASKQNLEENIKFYENISMEDVSFYFENIDVTTSLTKDEKDLLEQISNYLTLENCEKSDIENLLQIEQIIINAQKFFSDKFEASTLDQFSFEDEDPASALDVFLTYINKLEKLKRPLLGYLFQDGNITKATREFKETFPFFGIENPEKEITTLQKAYDLFSYVFKELEDPEEFNNTIKKLQPSEFESLKSMSQKAKDLLKNENLQKYLELKRVKNLLEEGFKNQPKDLYAKSIHEVEELVTAEMTHFLDKRIIEYVDNNASEANTLKNIIKNKEKFPKGLFENLKKAFPCILAGIRDYGEFIPLEKDLFDLIIIDEASQVSIAQALPALIRGKKIVILGDDKQFSNVKSNNASKVTNQQYKSNIQKTFKDERINGEDTFGWMNKIKDNFDIKNSILKFTRFIRNYECLLKKHFRCYPEIISYSDKYFYGNQLQCMKVRGKPIDEVIKFEVIDHDGLLDETKNTNELEANFIIEKLKELKENDIEQSLGIITPHREQVSLLWEKINALSERDWLFEKCRLKIMTFDTCQGEERDYIFYSMVATKEKDKLVWIFPKDLSAGDDEYEGTVKAQRLNVGFSRAKECIHFVLSKPIEEFSGEIKTALIHYQNELEQGKKQIIGGTDEKSGMEHKIQKYFYETPFYKNNKEDIEFIPQFELGKYLKQLDKTYSHPAYKVDFLLIFKNQKIIIEYDGFKEHFTDLSEVNASNYEFYMKDEDVYRQKILEGYGYKFIRINRFNLGEDPIETLNVRLTNLLLKKKSQNQKF